MIWVLKMFLTNVWRKFKFYSFFLCLLFLMHCIMTRVKSQNGVKHKSSVNLYYVAVHIDLKGSPPKMTYLASLLPTLSMYGVNAILLEYEDMFPYVGSIANISSVNAYKRNELLMFINTAKINKMEIIPLIQTFGHMEYVLKLKEFAHLRENKISSGDICPSNTESLKLITTMLKQVIEFHAIIYPLTHIHIGCDEVHNLNRCPKCKERKLQSTDLFTNHVKEVSTIVKGISPYIKVLIWGDMLNQFKTPQTNFLYDVEAVSWEYAAYPKFSHKYFYNLHKNFNSIWIASAYKGADGRDAKIPNIKKRFQNHLSWMKFILGYKFGGEKRVHNFEGIILTGWSRYTHYSPQCELLPIAMPSLILNLLLIQTVQSGIVHGDLDLPYCKFFNKYLSKEFSDIFRNHGDTDKKCAFENTFLYVEHEKLFNNTLLSDCLHKFRKYEKQCTRINSYVELESTFTQCNKALGKLAHTKKIMRQMMVQYYKTPIINSYIDEIVNIPAKTIQEKIKYLKHCIKNPLWKMVALKISTSTMHNF